MKHQLINIILFSGMVIMACNTATEPIEEPNEGLIEISKPQFISEGMQLGVPAVELFPEKVSFNAAVSPAFNGNAFINIPLSGFVKDIFIKNGQQVNMGDVLFSITGNELIDLQRSYSESAAVLKQLQGNYERAQALSVDNIGTAKELLLAESAYNAERANNKALKLKVERLRLDPIKIESGVFYGSFNVYATIKGTISGLNASIGQYFEPQQTLVEIIDSEAFQLTLSVFEKDISKLQPGQQVVYFAPDRPTEVYKAVLSAIGKNINPETRAISCVADLSKNESKKLFNNQFVQGFVVVNTDTSLAVPELALLEYENEKFVLVLQHQTADNYFFKKEKVAVGRTQNKLVEVLTTFSRDTIIFNGVYNLQLE